MAAGNVPEDLAPDQAGILELGEPEVWERHRDARRIIKNFLSFSLAEVAGKLFRFVAVIYLVRVISVTGFGRLSFAQAVTANFVLFVGLGLDVLGAREIASRPEASARYIGMIVTMQAAAALCAYGALFLFVRSEVSGQIAELVLVYGMTVFLVALGVDWAAVGLEHGEIVAKWRILGHVSYLLLMLALVKGSDDLVRVPAIEIATTGIAVAGILFSVRRISGGISMSWPSREWARTLRHALPLAVSGVAITLYYTVDRLMLGLMHGPRSVAMYEASYKVILVFSMFGTVLLRSVLPSLSKLHATGKKDDFAKLVAAGAGLAFSGMVPTAILVAAAAGPAMTIVMGSAYASAAPVLGVLIWSAAILLVSTNFGTALVASGHQLSHTYAVTAGLVVNVILNVILIPRAGAVGAAVATVGADVVIVALAWLFLATQYTTVPVLRDAWRPVLSGAAMVVAVLFFGRHYWPAGVAAGVIVYATAMTLCGWRQSLEFQALRACFVRRAA